LVIQRLFAAGMTLQSTDSLIADDTAKARLAAVADDLDGTIRELRQAIYQLQTPVIADDFRHDVQQVIDRATSGSMLKARDRYAGPVGTLVPDPARPHVLAVIAEALSNTIRHAGAATVDVAVALEDGTLSVTVDDDGRGMDPAVTRRSGLSNLESRARELGGKVEVSGGSRGVGTRIIWSIPA
jgi:signal transduction histidine kinase